MTKSLLELELTTSSLTILNILKLKIKIENRISSFFFPKFLNSSGKTKSLRIRFFFGNTHYIHNTVMGILKDVDVKLSCQSRASNHFLFKQYEEKSIFDCSQALQLCTLCIIEITKHYSTGVSIARSPKKKARKRV